MELLLRYAVRITRAKHLTIIEKLKFNRKLTLLNFNDSPVATHVSNEWGSITPRTIRVRWNRGSRKTDIKLENIPTESSNVQRDDQLG